MMEQQKRKEKFGKNLIKKEVNFSKILLLFLYAQPILDALFAITNNYFNFSISINTIIRFTFLIGSIFYLIIFNKDKKSKIYTLIIMAYLIAFIINTFIVKDKNILFFELRNMLSTFYFPIVITFFYQQKPDFIKPKNYLIISLIYFSLILFPNLLGIGFKSYMHDKSGYVGWFYSANTIGAIISILMPVIISYFIQNKKYLPLIGYISIAIYIALTMGTKTPLLGIAFVIGMYMLYLIIYLLKTKKYKYFTFIIIGCLVLLTGIYLIIPKTTFYQNIKHHMSYFHVTKISEVFQNEELINQVVYSKRLTFWNNTKQNYKQSNLSSKLLGIGYIENYLKENESTKTIEMDYQDIYYRSGIIGFIIYFIPLIMVLFDLIKNSKFKTLKTYSYWISILLSLVLAYFTGHILTSPSVSIIIIYIICSLRWDNYEKSKS